MKNEIRTPSYNLLIGKVEFVEGKWVFEIKNRGKEDQIEVDLLIDKLNEIKQG